MDKTVTDDEATIEENSSDIDSDNDENICKSPQKSPRKLSSVLKRKRNRSGPSNSTENSDSENDEETNDDSVVSAQKTPDDFQFKEPTFRKKQFIFHPFKLVEGNNEDI